MKKLLMVPNGEHFAARFLKTTLVLLTGLALATAFWVASTPVANAQGGNPAQFIESQLPSGKTMQNASKADFLSAVCAAVKKHKNAAAQIVRVAVAARPEWKNDILRTAFNCLGTGDCALLGRVLRGAIAGSPGDANDLTQVAIEAAPGCASSFGGGQPGEDEGNFGNAPGGNQNPPPGTIAGGGGQGNVVAICHNGHTIFVSPNGAEAHLSQHAGDSLGPCQVTAVTNQ
jgi:hypothetical protein